MLEVNEMVHDVIFLTYIFLEIKIVQIFYDNILSRQIPLLMQKGGGLLNTASDEGYPTQPISLCISLVLRCATANCRVTGLIPHFNR